MKTILYILVFIVPVVSSYAQSQVNYTVHGSVADENSAPLADVVVRLMGIDQPDTTDGAGTFTFETVPSGSYVLTAEKSGSFYLPYSKRIVISGETRKIAIVLRQRVYSASEIVVINTPESSPERMENAPSQVDVVTRAEFEHTAVTVEDVIASTPSASITSYGGLGSYSEVSLRGSYSNQVQVYIDGMLLNEAVGGSVNLGLIPLTNVDRVEVWRSGAPAKFGGDGVGGAINIVTRNSRTNASSVSLGYGSFDTVTGSGIFGFGPPESHVAVSVDGASSRNDFEYTSDNGTTQNPDDDYTTYRRNNQFRMLNGLVKYQRLIGDDLSFELSEHVLHSRKNLPSTQHILYSNSSLTTTKNLFQSRLDWMPDSMPWFEMSPALHSIVSREHYLDKEDQVGWGEQDNIYETVTFKGMVPVAVRHSVFGELTLTPVAAHESYSPEHRLDTTVPVSSDREQYGVVGDFALHTPGSKVAMTGNIRRDRYYSEYEGQTSLFNPEPPDPQYHHLTNVQTGLKIEPHELVSFRWNYGDNWRVPSFYELFGDRGSAVASPGLKPEHVYRWDIGARFTIPRTHKCFSGRLDFVYFENTYRNLIQWYTTNYGFIESANVAGSYVKGTEIILNTRLPYSFSLRGNWTIQKSNITASSKVYHQGKRLPNRPGQYGVCTLEYARRRASLFWTVDYKDSYFLDRSNQPHKKYPGRTLHDIGLSYRMHNNKISWRFMIENLTDQRTFDIQGMPKPGRSYMVTISYSSL